MRLRSLSDAQHEGSACDAETALNRRVYERIRGQIVAGYLRPGAKVSSTRVLATILGVSRNTVVKAFEQLTAEGYLRGKSGSGTYVAPELPDNLMHAPQSRSSAKGSKKASYFISSRRFGTSTWRASLPLQDARLIRPFLPGIPALNEFPYDIWTRLVNRQWKSRHPQLLGYSGAAGLPILREAICSYLTISRAVQCQPQQIFIVAGMQQALHLVTNVLMKPGDPMWIEEPGYFAAQSVFEAASVKLIPVRVDSDGLDVSAGIAAHPRPRLIYTTPANQFPLGVTMSIARRIELLRLAAKSRARIVEDDYDGEYRYSSRPLPALQSLDRNGSVIYVGTFSKVLFPALRLGYIVVPNDLIGPMLEAKFAADWHSPTIDQAVLADFMIEGHLIRHIRKMRALYLERRDALVEGVRSQLDGVVSIAPPGGGMHAVAYLPAGIEDFILSVALDKQGVSTIPLSRCYLSRNRMSGLLLGYAAFTPKQIKQGCRQLSVVLRSLDKFSRFGKNDVAPNNSSEPSKAGRQ